MNITNEQLEFISQNLMHYGIESEDLKEDILDHICIQIETGKENDFETAYAKAITAFGGTVEIEKIQQQTTYLLNENMLIKRRRFVYVTKFIVAFLFSFGTLFKMQHWPGANVMLLMGFLVLNFMLLPVYFYERYKTSIHKI